MRDIKFRALADVKIGPNLYTRQFVYGGIYVHDETCSYITTNDFEFVSFLNGTLGQFTGLQDEKAIDIYNNDICYVEGHGNCLVKTCVYYGVTFVNAEGSEVSAIDCMPDGDAFTVIGNIHQNPELLENKQ